MLMTGFEPRTSGIGSARLNSWATTTSQPSQLFTFLFPLQIDQCSWTNSFNYANISSEKLQHWSSPDRRFTIFYPSQVSSPTTSSKNTILFWRSCKGDFILTQVYGFNMTPFKEVVLGRQRKICEPEIMILKPEQLLSEPQVVAEFDLKEVK